MQVKVFCCLLNVSTDLCSRPRLNRKELRKSGLKEVCPKTEKQPHTSLDCCHESGLQTTQSRGKRRSKREEGGRRIRGWLERRIAARLDTLFRLFGRREIQERQTVSRLLHSLQRISTDPSEAAIVS